MVHTVNSKLGLLVAGMFALVAPAQVSADEIVLTFLDTDIELAGEFAGFTQNAYIIETEDGNLHVPVALITCEGTPCFEFASTDQADG